MGIKLTGVNLGYMELDYQMLVDPDPATYWDRLARGELRPRPYQCPSVSYVIDHPEGRVLWNTGISATWPEEWLQDWLNLVNLQSVTPEVCLEARLKSLGLGPEDFRYVVQGHLHCDHAGGLRMFERAGATILVHEDEYKHVQQVQTAENFFVRRDWAFLSEKKPTLLYGDTELLKGLRILSLPGHTPGTVGLVVPLDRTGTVLLTDDAMYTHETLGPPAIGTPVTWDPSHWAASIEKIRRVATDTNAFLFPGHDETGIKVQPGGQTEFQKIEFHPFSPGYTYE